jgi:glycerate kinase
MKIIVAPDKFKGSLSSFEVCEAISRGIRKTLGNAVVSNFPMADGGDGFASVLKHYLDTTTIRCDTVDPLGRTITASYQWNETKKTAIIEMAVASGLVLLSKEERNPLLTSTLGTGLLIRHAIDNGARKIILGLGGSATNDGGTGILSALGFQFAKEKGERLPASGENLQLIRTIIPPPAIPAIEFDLACDVNNVLFGPAGAAYVYAPQKGADKDQVAMLDQGLQNFSNVIMGQTGKDISTIPGLGAAGGIAAGLLPFFAVYIRNGIEMVIAASKIEEHLSNADMVITGEGKIDNQSSAGKVVGRIASLAKKHGLNCIAFCGSMELNESEELGLKKIVALVDEFTTEEQAIKNAANLLEEKVTQTIKTL